MLALSAFLFVRAFPARSCLRSSPSSAAPADRTADHSTRLAGERQARATRKAEKGQTARKKEENSIPRRISRISRIDRRGMGTSPLSPCPIPFFPFALKPFKRLAMGTRRSSAVLRARPHPAFLPTVGPIRYLITPPHRDMAGQAQTYPSIPYVVLHARLRRVSVGSGMDFLSLARSCFLSFWQNLQSSLQGLPSAAAPLLRWSRSKLFSARGR